MKTLRLAGWSLTVIAAVALALVMLAAITLSACVLMAMAVVLLPLDAIIRLASLISPAIDRWTSWQYARLDAWLKRMRPGR
jgi:hypothetical protein